MAQGDDDSAAGASFTIPEPVCDTNQTFEIDTEDFPGNLDAQTWEWTELLPALHLPRKFRKSRMYRNSTNIVNVAQSIFSGFMAPSGEFPRWLPEDTILETIRALQFLCGQGRATNHPFTLEQIKNFVNAEEESLIVPGVVQDSVEFLHVVNQLRRTQYILSDGRARGLEKIVGPGVIRTKRDRENSLLTAEIVHFRLERHLNSMSSSSFVSTLELADISSETLQAINVLASQSEQDFRKGVLALPISSKREAVTVLDGGLGNTVRATVKDARTGNKVRSGGAKGHKVAHGTTAGKAKRRAEYQSRLDALSQEHVNESHWVLCARLGVDFGISQRTAYRNTQNPRKK